MLHDSEQPPEVCGNDRINALFASPYKGDRALGGVLLGLRAVGFGVLLGTLFVGLILAVFGIVTNV